MTTIGEINEMRINPQAAGCKSCGVMSHGYFKNMASPEWVYLCRACFKCRDVMCNYKYDQRYIGIGLDDGEIEEYTMVTYTIHTAVNNTLLYKSYTSLSMVDEDVLKFIELHNQRHGCSLTRENVKVTVVE